MLVNFFFQLNRSVILFIEKIGSGYIKYSDKFFYSKTRSIRRIFFRKLNSNILNFASIVTYNFGMILLICLLFLFATFSAILVPDRASDFLDETIHIVVISLVPLGIIFEILNRSIRIENRLRRVLLAKKSANRLEAGDVLYLRSIALDNRLGLVESAFDFHQFVGERSKGRKIEDVLSSSIPATSRLIKAGPGKATDKDAGIIKFDSSDPALWGQKILEISRTVNTIIILPIVYKNSGLLREMQLLNENGLIEKCLFIMPGEQEIVAASGLTGTGGNLDVYRISELWQISSKLVQNCGFDLPEYEKSGALFRIEKNGTQLFYEVAGKRWWSIAIFSHFIRSGQLGIGPFRAARSIAVSVLAAQLRIFAIYLAICFAVKYVWAGEGSVFEVTLAIYPNLPLVNWIIGNAFELIRMSKSWLSGAKRWMYLMFSAAYSLFLGSILYIYGSPDVSKTVFQYSILIFPVSFICSAIFMLTVESKFISAFR